MIQLLVEGAAVFGFALVVATLASKVCDLLFMRD